MMPFSNSPNISDVCSSQWPCPITIYSLNITEVRIFYVYSLNITEVRIFYDFQRNITYTIQSYIINTTEYHKFIIVC